MHRSRIRRQLAIAFALLIGTVFGSGERFSLAAIPADPWMNTDWLDRKQLTFNNSAQSTNLVNFPVLIKLDSTRIDFSKTQDAGEDLRFTDSDGTTALDYEIEEWDESGTCSVWVRVPQIDASSSSDYIWMYYNNTLATDDQDPANVWDANYMFVWHCQESAGTTIADSTANAWDGTKLSATEPNPASSGMISGAQDYDGIDDGIGITNDPVPEVAITMEAWIRPDTISDPTWRTIAHFHGDKPFIGFAESDDVAGKPVLDYWRKDKELKGTTIVPFNEWSHVAVTHAGGLASLYFNGALDNSGAVPKSDRGEDFYAGVWKTGTTDSPFDGMMDELRVSTVMRSADWIAAQYLSMTDAFITTWAPPLYTDVSSGVGFDVQTTSGADNYGSGFYWADYDDDGDLDVIITGNASKLMLSNSEGQSFSDSSLGGGLRRQGAMADLDNDGDIDFWAGNDNSYYAAAWFMNDGSAYFTDEGDRGFSDPSNNEGVAAADVNLDGWCDIIHFSANGNWIGFNQTRPVIALSGTNDDSYGLNDGGDYGNADYCSAGDANNDGYLDFFYHLNGGKLFLSNGDGTYTHNNNGISVVTGENDKMGSAWGDYDNDGDLDLFVCRYDSGQPGYLWRNDNGTFSDAAAAAGITDTTGQRSCCWGDYDNDGDLDLYVVTHSGNANVLYQNQGDGTFLSANEGAYALGDGHDAVFVDYDNDGDLDLAITQQSEGNTLLRNELDSTGYLKVRVIGHGVIMTNRAAVGVRVELFESDGTTFLARREIGVARGFAGSEPLWLHFGGVTSSATYVVKVHFVSGVQEVTVVPQNVSTTIDTTVIDQMLTVQERKPQVSRWTEVKPK